MQSTFPRLRFCLIVGVGGGIPSEKNDIRLGDIVVSLPDGQNGGVIKYDMGKMEVGGFKRLGMLNKPPVVLRNGVTKLRATRGLRGQLSVLINDAAIEEDEDDEEEWKYPKRIEDMLFHASFEHVGRGSTCKACADAAKSEKSNVISRDPRPTQNSKIFYGNIASGDQVIKKATTRDLLAEREGVICFEMEAAGLMDHLPCLVIRGICDYANSHKNKKWQPYAAIAAAAYAKKLLSVITPEAVTEMETMLSE